MAACTICCTQGDGFYILNNTGVQNQTTNISSPVPTTTIFVASSSSSSPISAKLNACIVAASAAGGFISSAVIALIIICFYRRLLARHHAPYRPPPPASDGKEVNHTPAKTKEQRKQRIVEPSAKGIPAEMGPSTPKRSGHSMSRIQLPPLPAWEKLPQDLQTIA